MELHAWPDSWPPQQEALGRRKELVHIWRPLWVYPFIFVLKRFNSLMERALRVLQGGISGEGPNVELNAMNSASKTDINQIVKVSFFPKFLLWLFCKEVQWLIKACWAVLYTNSSLFGLHNFCSVEIWEVIRLTSSLCTFERELNCLDLLLLNILCGSMDPKGQTTMSSSVIASSISGCGLGRAQRF